MDAAEADRARSLVERWAAGVRARDVDAVLSGHAPELLVFDVDGEWTIVHEHHSQPLDFDAARIG